MFQIIPLMNEEKFTLFGVSVSDVLDLIPVICIKLRSTQLTFCFSVLSVARLTNDNDNAMRHLSMIHLRK